MSDQEIDWDKYLEELNNPDAKPREVSNEQLVAQMLRMKNAADIRPKFHYIKMLFALGYIICNFGLMYYVETNQFPYKYGIFAFLVLQVYLLIDYFVLTRRVNNQARGKR